VTFIWCGPSDKDSEGNPDVFPVPPTHEPEPDDPDPDDETQELVRPVKT
jgi:hypothetical protein